MENTYKKSVLVSNKLSINTFQKRLDEFKETEYYLRKLNKYNCLTSVKNIDDIYEYHLDNGKIILKNRMGSKSKYGIIFLTTNKFNKKLFATKLTNMTDENTREIDISRHLSDISIKKLSPHFLLIYKTFFCLNKKTDKYIPNLIKYENYYISINELINGTLKQFLHLKLPFEFVLNAFQQIIISILSFHYFTNGIYHHDCHYKNFLYVKIKAGGYFHYKLFGNDYYIKNLGYLWLIWDFGLARDDDYSKSLRIKDYFRIIEFFQLDNDLSLMSVLDKNIINIARQILTYRNNYLYYFENSDKKFFDECIFKNNLLLTKLDIKTSIKTINKKPYIINDF
jgi:hypothetical protein